MVKLFSVMIVTVVSVFSLPLPAQASTAIEYETFMFTGTCTSGCTGDATAYLTLNNLGINVDVSNFLSFTYVSTDINVGPFDASAVTAFSATLSSDLSTVDSVAYLDATVDGQPFSFTYSSTSWEASFDPTDQGNVGHWALVTPLPAALPLFATGLGALGLLGWRRKRKAHAVAA